MEFPKRIQKRMAQAARGLREHAGQIDLPEQTVRQPLQPASHTEERLRRQEKAKAAVLVVHGMGQQLRFESLDRVVTGLHGAEQEASDTAIELQSGASVRIVRLGDQDLAQAEMELGADGDRTHVHLYEGYWAPLMEGNVKLVDVMGFLKGGVSNGLRNCFKTFRRRMFGKDIELPIVRRTPLFLLIALLTVISLIVVNSASAFVIASVTASTFAEEWVSDAFLQDVTHVLLSLLILLTLWWLCMKFSKSMVFFWLLLLSGILAGGAFLWLIFVHRGTNGSAWPWPLPMPWATGSHDRALVIAAWLPILFTSLFVRRMLLEYVGDVVAYVSPHKLDRFFALRRKVKDTVFRTAHDIYNARTSDGRFLYDRVAIVGHSLGSVVAYDTLNKLINDDLMVAEGERIHVVDRTKLFLTFGSPLDKTAFIFRSQTFHANETLQNLALASQPLIRDYQYRTFDWVNIWSKKDIISGPLDFYDDPEDEKYDERRVRNHEDGNADVPLYAHIQYWQNPLIYSWLHAALTGTGDLASELN